QKLLDAVKDLTDEQLHFSPLSKGNHIAFTIWHCVRTEDLVIGLMLQKKTPVWNEEGWDEKLGLDSRAQGTGMSDEDAAAVRIKDLPAFLQYMENTYSATNAYLNGLKEEDLDEVRDMPMMGSRSLRETIGGTLVQHGIGHLSEIWYTKGLQGLQGSPV
ncbi:MAG: DinB family protein, partial [Desulfobacterales bacterium]